MKYIVIVLIGALASILANRGIAVFNDGFRPILPQYFEGKISRKELAALSFAISFGLVIGFGIPTSIAATILLIHCVLLSTDIIGTWCPDSKLGLILAGVIGGLYGLGILLGLEFIVKIFSILPYNFLNQLGGVSAYVIAVFAIFPAIAVGYQHGAAKGAIAAGITVLAYFIFKKIGVIPMGAYKITLSAEGMAMLVDTILMIIFAARVKGDSTSNITLTEVFSGKVERIRKNWFLLAIMGGLIAMGTSLSIIAGDPASLALLAKGEYTSAALTAFARAIGFIPLIFTTAIVTGVYASAGCTFVFVIGLLLHGKPFFALILGAAVLIAELLLINVFARGMDRFPGIREMGEHIRTSMSRVLEVALLVGSVAAAEKMSAAAAGLTGAGALFVIACLLINRQSKKGIVEMAVGPVACIVFGILLNLLLAIGLIQMPA